MATKKKAEKKKVVSRSRKKKGVIRKRRTENTSIDFYDSQGNVGDKYFMYIIQRGEHDGAGTSCYFWYSSPSQLLSSIKNHIDFWQWRDGHESAAEALTRIIDSHGNGTALSNELRADLNEYMRDNANIWLRAWGRFEDLCSSAELFCAEVRSDFREHVADNAQDDQVAADEPVSSEKSRAISRKELEGFCEFLAVTPT